MKSIYYHSADHDGHCSGAIAKRYCELNGLEYELCPINYGDQMPDLTGKDIIMCDFSIEPEALMRESFKKANSFIWIDHHISAINAFKDLNIEGLRNTELAACELTWMYFFPNDKIPLGVTYLGAYDSWRHNGDVNILGYEWFLRSYETDPSIFDWEKEIFSASNEYIGTKTELGLISYNKDLQDWTSQMKNSFEKTIGNKSVLCLNSQSKGSMIFGSRLKDYDFVVIFYITSKGMYKHSLYSAEGKEDVSVIAKTFGGGGHAHASGCHMERPIWEL